MSTATEHAPFNPTLRQAELWQHMESSAAEQGTVLIGYGGAMGGGKTRALVQLALDTALDFPGTRILIARLRYTDLRSTTMSEFFEQCPERIIAERQRSRPERVVLRGSDFPLGVRSAVHFRHLSDWSGLGSEQYGAIFVDEAGEVSEDAARMLITRLRHPAQPFRFFVAASNPWPGWFERWFVRGELGLDRSEAERLTFIPARIRDNPWLPENYERIQRAILSDDWIERFVEGRFDNLIGLVYPRFDRVRHRWDDPLPPFARYLGGLDFGGLAAHHHFTAGIMAGLTGPRAACGADILIRLEEFEERGEGVIERLERWMRDCGRRWGGVIHWRADRSQSAWIDQCRRRGLAVRQSQGGPHSVQAGIELVQRRLSWSEDGRPRSYYAPSLRLFPERMLEYRWAPPQEDGGGAAARPVKEQDDLLDADRYMHEEAEGGRMRKPGPAKFGLAHSRGPHAAQRRRT